MCFTDKPMAKKAVLMGNPVGAGQQKCKSRRTKGLQGKDSPVFENHLFWPSPPKKTRRGSNLLQSYCFQLVYQHKNGVNFNERKSHSVMQSRYV